MEQSQPQTESAGYVEGSLNYLASAIPKPVNYAYEPPPGVPKRSGSYAAHPVRIRNGREVSGQLSLDRQGFVLTPHETAVRDFYDPEEVRSVYYPEIEKLVKAITGAHRVAVFDHVVRNPKLADQKRAGAPIRVVHNDYTFMSAPRRVRTHLPDEADQLLSHRFAEVNIWRPIRGPLQDTPLAVCDAGSIAPSDVVLSELVYPGFVGETWGFLFNPNHRWFYFPKLQRNEAIVLKCFDSKEDGRARFTAHSAFDDPTSPADRIPRESIETRALVFWPD
ncbi:MAG TPA: CmcJ/NvfI family oxidoreductase [Candidatus Binataceae bacterium]|jgi:hypothetical protein|nr:CmcJ/NvfI family oxidoreductase [Candidatus Binataceae bacterium]